jgi:hypothetical protein
MMAGAMLAALILVCGVDHADAATLRAEYRFQGDLASEIASAPDLANIGQGNSFASERINGLGLQSVLRFPEGNGLSLNTTGLVNPTNNSVVMVFRLASTSGYRASSTSPAESRIPGSTTSMDAWRSMAPAAPARTPC